LISISIAAFLGDAADATAGMLIATSAKTATAPDKASMLRRVGITSLTTSFLLPNM
jgi:hypothetical protein